MSASTIVHFCDRFDSDHAPVVAVISSWEGVREVEISAMTAGFMVSNKQVITIPVPDDAPYGAYASAIVPSGSYNEPIWPDAIKPPAPEPMDRCEFCNSPYCCGDC